MTMNDASDVHEADQIQANSIFLRQISQGVHVRLSEPLQIPGNDGHANLLAISNQRGLIFASTNEGFLLHSLKDLRQEFKDAKRGTEPKLKPLRSIQTAADAGLGDRVTFLRIADQDQTIVVGLANGKVAIWSIEALYNNESASPLYVLQPPSPDLTLREVSPNPSDRPEICAVIFVKRDETSKQSGSVAILNLRSGEWKGEISTPEKVPITSISWSVKGKQLVLGLENGQLAQVTPEGELKSVLPKASDLSGDHYVDNILWLENNVFIVTYNMPQTSEQPEHTYEIYALLRDTSSNNKISFVHFTDPAPPFGDTSRRGHRYVSWLKSWQPMKHMLFMANTSSTDVGLLGCSSEKTGQTAWEVIELEDTSRPALPFSSLDRSADTSPVGLEMDVTSGEAIDDPQAAARGEDGKGKLSAVPILLVYTNDGVLLAYHVINLSDQAGKYAHMVALDGESGSTDSTTGRSTAAKRSNDAPNLQVSTPSTSQPSFAQTTTFGQPSGFGQPLSSGQASSFGHGSGFGQTSAFGSGSFGSQSAQNIPSFGQPAQIGAKPASAFSAFSNSGNSSSFSGGFGGFASKPNAAGFGAPSGSNSVFGQPSPSDTSNQQTPPSTFGQSSGFGSFANKGDNVFGQSTSSNTGQPSAFGKVTTSFGNSSTPTFGSLSRKGSGVFGQQAQKDSGPPSSFTFGQQNASAAPKVGISSAFEAHTNGDDSRKDTSSGPFGLDDLSATLGDQSSEPTPFAIKSDDEDGKKDENDDKNLSWVQSSESNTKKSDENAGNKEKPASYNFDIVSEAFKTKASDTIDSKTLQQNDKEDEKAEKAENDVPSAYKKDDVGDKGDDSKDKIDGKQQVSFGEKNASTKNEEEGSTIFKAGKKQEDGKEDKKEEPLKGFGTPTFDQPSAFGAKGTSPFSFAPAKNIANSESATASSPFSTGSAFSAKSTGGFGTFGGVTSQKSPGFGTATLPKNQQEEKKESNAPSSAFSAPSKNAYETNETSKVASEAKSDPLGEAGSNAVIEKSEKSNEPFAAPEVTVTTEKANGEDSHVTQQPVSAKPIEEKKEDSFLNFVNRAPRSSSPLSGAPVNRADLPQPALKPNHAFGGTSGSSPSGGNAFSFNSPESAKLTKPTFSFAPSATKTEQPSHQSAIFHGTSAQSKDSPVQKPTFSFASSKSLVPNEGHKEPFKGFSFAPTPMTPKKEGMQAPKQTTTPIGSPLQRSQEPDARPQAAIAEASRFESAVPATTLPDQLSKPSKSISTPISTPPKFSVQAVDIQSSSDTQGQGLQDVFLRTYLIMEKELGILRQNVESCAKFQSRIRKSGNELLETEDLANVGLWTFGELESKSKITKNLLKELESINEGFKGEEFCVRQMRAEQIKVELKLEEIERFVRARSDPDFGKMIKVRQLGPEHTENQQRLRRAILNLRQTVTDFESQLESIRRSVVDAKLGKAKSMEIPSIDRINRTVRNITRSAEAKLMELEALELMYESLFNTRSAYEVKELNGLSSLSLGNIGEQSVSFADNSFPSLGNIASHLPNVKTKQNEANAAHRTYEKHKQADKIRNAFLKARKEPVLNTRMRKQGELKQETNFETSDLNMVFARGTVNLDENRQERMIAAREREETERIARLQKETDDAARVNLAATNDQAKAELQASEFAKSYASLNQAIPKFEPTPFTAAEAKKNIVNSTSVPALNFSTTLPPGALDFSTSTSFAPRSSNTGESAPNQSSIGRTHHNSKPSKRQPAVSLQSQQSSEIPSTFKADFFAMPSTKNEKSNTDQKPFNFASAPTQRQNDAKGNAKAFGFGAWSPPSQPKSEMKNGFSFGLNNNNPSFSSFTNPASSTTTFKGLQNMQPISKNTSENPSNGAPASMQSPSFARPNAHLSNDDVDDGEEGEDVDADEEENEEGEYEDDDYDPDYSDVEEEEEGEEDIDDNEEEEEGLSAIGEGEEEEEDE